MIEYFETVISEAEYDKIELLRLEDIQKIKDEIEESNKKLLEIKDKIQNNNFNIEKKTKEIENYISKWNIENAKLIV